MIDPCSSENIDIFAYNPENMARSFYQATENSLTTQVIGYVEKLWCYFLHNLGFLCCFVELRSICSEVFYLEISKYKTFLLHMCNNVSEVAIRLVNRRVFFITIRDNALLYIFPMFILHEPIKRRT